MISLIIPAYNEADSIGATIDGARQALSSAGIEHEIIVVDDGSSDSTGDLAAKTGATVIKHLYNLGYGKSLKNGIASAKYEHIAIIDADGSYPHGDLPKLYAEFKKGYHLIIGARQGKHYYESDFKAALRQALKWLVEFTVGSRIADVNSGMRIFNKADILKIDARLCNTFSFTTSMTMIYMLNGLYVGFMPIEYHKRAGRSKVRLFRDTLRTLQYIVDAILFYNPVKLFLLFAALAAFVSATCFAAAAAFGSSTAFASGVNGIYATVIVLCLGWIANIIRLTAGK